MVTKIVKCRYCSSERLIKAGKQSGHQRLKCKDCQRTFQLDYTYEAHKAGVKEQIEILVHNGSGIRDTARVLKINKNTVIDHLKKAKLVTNVNEAFIRKLPDEQEKVALTRLELSVCIAAECDEQWSFVRHKDNKRWLWYILEKSTRKVLAFTFGARDNKTYQKLVNLLPCGLIDQLDTDKWKAYQSIRFTPIHRIGKDLTWRIERKNLDLRTRIKRLARRTICFSKSKLLHDTIIGRFINLYLF